MLTAEWCREDEKFAEAVAVRGPLADRPRAELRAKALRIAARVLDDDVVGEVREILIRAWEDNDGDWSVMARAVIDHLKGDIDVDL